MKIVFICSTAGSVIRKALDTGALDSFDVEIVSDRECQAIEYAMNNGLSYLVLESKTGRDFSSKLNEKYIDSEGSLFVSFYTKILTAPFIDDKFGRIINFHPSILPACPGMDGFGDTIKSGALFIGSTVHLIDSGMDTGSPLLQAAYPRNQSISEKDLRHRVFLQQVISLVQICKWYSENRVKIINGKSYVTDASYSVGEFSPNLDDECLGLFNNSLKNMTVS
ncbi:phosphoribosylglycinamide formyltransferase [Vibrio cyclitrophicus]|uniref:phosphoribosylglycinamide formyltransferase n=1 Tax=Vibrio cyclitrophicus TaxID=47951 RepID=UPI0032E3A69B